MSRRVLVAYGSRRGSTAEIAASIAEAMRERGLLVDCAPADEIRDVAAYDAVIVGGALYAGRWIREARRFLIRHARALRRRPVWLFSSGPLDASRDPKVLEPVPRVAALCRWIGARGHATFGGRLAANADGFLASAMAKKMAGDWRDWPTIRAWGQSIAQAIETSDPPTATPAPRPARWPLALLCVVVAITVIGGGGSLVASPDGTLLHAPRALLAHTPFSSFLIPGLLLMLVIGGTHLRAAARIVRDVPGAETAALQAGGVLLLWIVVEILLLRAIHWLQIGYFVIGILIVLEATRLVTAADRSAHRLLERHLR